MAADTPPGEAAFGCFDLFAAVMRPDGVLLAANESALERSGLARTDVIGRPFWDCDWWSHDAGARERLRDAVSRCAAGETIRYEARVRAPGGGLVDIELILSPVADESGKVAWLVPAAAPREARGAALSADAALDRLSRLETLYRTAPIGLCVLDRDLRFLRVNDRLAEINGVPPADHLGRHVREVVPDLTEQAEAMLAGVLDGGRLVQDIEIVGETPAAPGVRRVWIEHVAPVRDAGGAIVAISIAAEEVTERRRLEDALRASEAEARRLASRRSVQMREYSHRVKNALAMVGAMLSLQGRGASPETRRALDEAGRRVLAVSDVQDAFSEAERMDAVGLEPIIRRIADRIAALRPEIVVSVEVERGVETSGERAASLGLLVSELLMNAIKHAWPAAAPGRAVVTVRREGAGIVVSVEDDGSGLAADWPGPARGGLGARLVHALSEQLSATLETGRSRFGGARFTLHVPPA